MKKRISVFTNIDAIKHLEAHYESPREGQLGRVTGATHTLDSQPALHESLLGEIRERGLLNRELAKNLLDLVAIETRDPRRPGRAILTATIEDQEIHQKTLRLTVAQRAALEVWAHGWRQDPEERDDFWIDQVSSMEEGGRPSDAPRAEAIEVDGQFVLDDPDALARIRAVKRSNLKGLIAGSAELVKHFRERSRALSGGATTHVILILTASWEQVGGALTDLLLPGKTLHRNPGESPVVRGLAGRKDIERALQAFDLTAAEKLSTWDQDKLAVVVVDQGVADVF